MKILDLLTEKRITGNIGEDAVCKLLRKKHYKIIERNYVQSGHEIDIIAENKEFICFVEVKTRSRKAISALEGRPAAAVTPQKQRSIISAASVFAAINGGKKKFRFDVAEVYLDDSKKVDEIVYLEGAFNCNTAYQTQHKY